MGLENGANCLGCCLVLMLLLFVGGVMNLVLVALIAAFVLVEKVLSCGDVWARYTAIPLAIAGIGVIVCEFATRSGVM